jgi:hypothetical protein
MAKTRANSRCIRRVQVNERREGRASSTPGCSVQQRSMREHVRCFDPSTVETKRHGPVQPSRALVMVEVMMVRNIRRGA